MDTDKDKEIQVAIQKAAEQWVNLMMMFLRSKRTKRGSANKK